MLDQNPLHPLCADRHTRVFAALLHLYPARFRQAYGAEMLILFRDCLRDARLDNGQGVPRLWLSTFSDLSSSAPRAHLEEWTQMETPYTRSSQVGAVVAVATALFFIGLNLGFIDVDKPGVGATTVIIALFSFSWFGMLAALYRRIEAEQPSSDNKASLAVGGVSLLLMLATTALYASGNPDSGALAAVAMLTGVVSLALLGMSGSRIPDLGPWRAAPLLAAVPSALFIITWFVEWNEALVFAGAACTVLSFVGTAVLLWTTARGK